MLRKRRSQRLVLLAGLLPQQKRGAFDMGTEIWDSVRNSQCAWRERTCGSPSSYGNALPGIGRSTRRLGGVPTRGPWSGPPVAVTRQACLDAEE